MPAYEMALGTAPAGVGAERNRPGSVASAVASYFGSTEFCDDLAPSTQAIRRVLLEKFRREHGDKPIALLRKFIDEMLRALRRGARKNWLKALRGLLQYCVAEGLCKEDVTATSSRRRRAGASTPGPMTRSRNSRRIIRSARSPRLAFARCCSTPASGAAT